MIRSALLRLLPSLVLASLVAASPWPVKAQGERPGGVAASASTAAPAPLGQEEARAVEAVSAALATTPDTLDRLLAVVGFDPNAQTIPGFAEWPTLRKVDAAYKWAVAAGGVAEGARLLGRIARMIERDHSAAIRHESPLARYFEDADTGGPIRYARPNPAELAALPPLEVRKAIIAIERYVDRVPGGLQAVILVCCVNAGDLDSVYEILHAAPNRLEALISAIQSGKLPPDARARLLRALRSVLERSMAVSYEPGLAVLLRSFDWGGDEALVPVTVPEPPRATTEATERDELRKLYLDVAREARRDRSDDVRALSALGLDERGREEPRPAVPGRMGRDRPDDSAHAATPGGGGGGGGGEAANARRFAEMQRSVVESALPGTVRPIGTGPGGMPRFGFKTMRVSAAGPGGVLFGNEVDAAGVTKPVRMTWVADAAAGSAAPSWGHYDIELGANEVVLSQRMRAADAYAAWEIVTGRGEGAGAFAPLDAGAGEGAALASVVKGASTMLVHPALYGLELGDLAARADAVGFRLTPGAFCQALRVARIPPVSIRQALRWQTAKSGWYKLLDAPVRIVSEGGALTVIRNPDAASPAPSSAALLDFQAIAGDKPVANPDFLPALPALIAGFPEFARLNAFAETFAITRWAKLSGAEVKPPPKPSRKTPNLDVGKDQGGDFEVFSEGTPAERIDQIERAGVGLDCLLEVSGISQAGRAWIRPAVEALKQVQRIVILSERLDKSDLTEREPDAATAIDAALTARLRASLALLEPLGTTDGMLAALRPGPDGTALPAMRLRAREAAARAEEQKKTFTRMTNPTMAIRDLAPDKRLEAESRLSALRRAADSYTEADPGESETSALTALKQAKAAFMASLPPRPDPLSVAKMRRDLAESEAAAESLRKQLDARIKAMSPDWAPGAKEATESLAERIEMLL